MEQAQKSPRVKGSSLLGKKAIEEISLNARGSIERSSRALVSHDIVGISKEFSGSFSVAGGDWRFDSRDDIVKRIESGRVKYEYIRSEIERIDVPTVNIAIVSGTRSVKAVVDGKDFAVTFPFKAVHILEDGQWRVGMWAVNC